MKIECLLLRKGGTFVELPGKIYHFAPQEDGKHVADVKTESHVERLLSIPEAYRLLRTSEAELPATFAAKVEALDTTKTSGILLGSDAHPATFDINGKTYSLGDIVARAFADSGLEEDTWNELDADTRATKIDIVLDGIEAGEIVLDKQDWQPEKPEQAQESATDEPTRKELAAQYEAKFGKRPSNATSIETIKAKLAE